MAREGVWNISRLTHDHIKSNGHTLDDLKLNAMHCILFYEATPNKKSCQCILYVMSFPPNAKLCIHLLE